MRNKGRVLSGPLKGLVFIGQVSRYALGGTEPDPRPGMVVCPLTPGYVVWNGRAWDWEARSLDAVEAYTLGTRAALQPKEGEG